MEDVLKLIAEVGLIEVPMGYSFDNPTNDGWRSTCNQRSL